MRNKGKKRPRDIKKPSMHVQRRGQVRTERRPPSINQEERPHQKPVLMAPWSWTLSLHNCGKINGCCLSLPVCGIVFWQPVYVLCTFQKVQPHVSPQALLSLNRQFIFSKSPINVVNMLPLAMNWMDGIPQTSFPSIKNKPEGMPGVLPTGGDRLPLPTFRPSLRRAAAQRLIPAVWFHPTVCIH